MKREKNWKEIWLSKLLVGANDSRKIAYVAVTTALMVVVNMFFEFKLAETQFSFTLLASMVAGTVLGPIFGFCACFLGDLVGFFYHSAGFAYLPWIGISMGLTAMLSGLIINALPEKKEWVVYLKIAFIALSSFLLCTVAINTTACWLLYAKVDYFTYLISRLFAQGQIWNSLVNYGLLFGIVPALNHIKPLKIYIK